MSDIQFPVRVPVLKVTQPLGEFFVATLPAKVLLEVSYSDPLRLHGFNEGGDYELKGSQRKLVIERLKSIGRFVDTVEAAFPNAVILAANYREDGQLEESHAKRWRVEAGEHDCFYLVIPTSEKLASLVDGQHRLYGFTYSKVPKRDEMPLVCSVYFDLPQPFQAYLFATINYHQKPVDKSQSYELFASFLELEEPASWSPDKTAVFMCRKLNTDGESPFKGHIIIAAQTDEAVSEAADRLQQEWGVSTAAVVEGILRLFSSNPKRDRDMMHQVSPENGRKRSLLANQTDATPLRKFYLETNDLLIFTLILNFFRAAKGVLWKGVPGSSIRKTVGIQAQFDVLRRLCVEAVEQKDISVEFFEVRLESCRRIDFSDDFFQFSGTGRTRLRNSLELRLGLRLPEELPRQEIEGYRRVGAIE